MLKQSPLNDEHLALGARMIDFGGWSLPVQYPTGIIEEHLNTRENAGLFDISHMGELKVSGGGAFDLLQYVSVNDVSLMGPGGAQYSTFCLENGTVVDDVFYYQYARDSFKVIVNAANKDKDLAWLNKNAARFKDVTIVDQSAQRARVSLQGPKAQDVLQSLVPVDLATVKRFQFTETELKEAVPAFVARTGYTGEDGFEISFPAGMAKAAWRSILGAGKPFHLLPAGLGARDTLRLEACYSLYGHEISESITPVEAGIEFIIKKAKQVDYIGKEALLNQLEHGTGRKIAGLKAIDKGIMRSGLEILDDAGAKRVGIITSGTFSPSLKESIALGLVDVDHNKIGAVVAVKVRDKHIRAKIVPRPFYAYHPRQ
ncbi:MAG: glycine cleavage system aminomethyltransferase GcvT [Candidatus Lokiarchaeota archaeon]|nr:glycine cleavage system aminomethyltransferase GcvT [Candidatus Lokiarchaeota archaeon]